MMRLINATTFGLTASADPLDRLEVEIGDSKQPDFKPQVKIMRWDNEVNLSIRAVEHPSATFTRDGEIVKYVAPDYEVHQYDKPDASNDGGFEFEWLLPKQPASNVLTATLQSKGLTFTQQPPLTLAEIERGDRRPARIVGSYAVYHATKGVTNDARGKSYRVGKFCHIYRPHAVDAAGAQAWCELSIDVRAGLLTVTVPQRFLDEATYPVRVDPTFGYTGIGGSLSSTDGTISMGRFSIGEDGTGTSISIRLTLGNTYNVKCNVYQDETGVTDVNVAALANGQTEERSLATAASAWYDFTFNAAPSFVSGTAYRLAVWADNPTGDAQGHYDVVAGENAYSRVLTYGAWPDPSGTLTRSADIRLSMYSTYTTGATLKRLTTLGVG